ncbi:hypothetical protein OVA03_07700 [Asticcacaulis sp. SL142]|uniref:hypothetical protein n=1 Tax=Asticcacaulis sp. SL142 TaxID=2995155 RepID=UPI00226D04B7|nr:hypothetical protein [Asticcacaulis sp. SL142]WAC49773.1 hypothetical protein OVA03_07700 [Asticcacaulis sp. SL142]
MEARVFWAGDADVVSLGGLIEPDALSGFQRQLHNLVLEAYQRQMRRCADEPFADQLDDLSLLFLRSASPNAFAIEKDGRRAVAICLGLFDALWGAFAMALSDSDFMPGYFDSEAPSSAGAMNRQGLRDPAWADIALPGWPEDRLAALNDLFYRAVDFLVCHELAHHARRHIPYLQDTLGIGRVDECLNATAGTNSDDAYRLIEFDADHHGLDLLVVGMIDDTERPWDLDRSQTQCFQSAVAILTVFLLFDLDHASVDLQYGSSHPAPVHRAMRLSAALTSTFARLFAWTDEDRIDWHDLAWITVGEIARILELPEGRWRGEFTQGMALARFCKEERALLKFARRFDRLP